MIPCGTPRHAPPRKPVSLLCKTTKSRQALLHRVVWTIAFAEVNATALRKLCKKADKVFSGGPPLGQQFLQVRIAVLIRCLMHTESTQRCWSSACPTMHAVLRSTLLAELRALESRLLSTLPTCTGIPDTLSITVDMRRPLRAVATDAVCDDEFVFTVAGIPNEAMQCAMCMVCVHCVLHSSLLKTSIRACCTSQWPLRVATTFAARACCAWHVWSTTLAPCGCAGAVRPPA